MMRLGVKEDDEAEEKRMVRLGNKKGGLGVEGKEVHEAGKEKRRMKRRKKRRG